MCTGLTACSALRYRTAAVRIDNICSQLLMFGELYGTVLQPYYSLKFVYCCYYFSVVRYRTPALRNVTMYVQFLLLVVLYGNVLQREELLQYVYRSYIL